MSYNVQDPPFSRVSRQVTRGAESGGVFCGFVGSDLTWTPAVNLYETAVSYRVCVDLAGVDKSRLDITVRPPADPGDPMRLVLRGERPVPQSPDVDANNAPRRDRIHRMEIDHGAFVREIELPADVDADRIAATYRAGLLWVELPKRR